MQSKMLTFAMEIMAEKILGIAVKLLVLDLSVLIIIAIPEKIHVF